MDPESNQLTNHPYDHSKKIVSLNLIFLPPGSILLPLQAVQERETNDPADLIFDLCLKRQTDRLYLVTPFVNNHVYCQEVLLDAVGMHTNPPTITHSLISSHPTTHIYPKRKVMLKHSFDTFLTKINSREAHLHIQEEEGSRRRKRSRNEKEIVLSLFLPVLFLLSLVSVKFVPDAKSSGKVHAGEWHERDSWPEWLKCKSFAENLLHSQTDNNFKVWERKFKESDENLFWFAVHLMRFMIYKQEVNWESFREKEEESKLHLFLSLIHLWIERRRRRRLKKRSKRRKKSVGVVSVTLSLIHHDCSHSFSADITWWR